MNFVKRTSVIITILTLLGIFLHFYNLNWGAPFYFHPDERNIASSVSQLSFPSQMNPHFFAYGSLPIYTIYFTGLLANYFSLLTSHFSLHSVTFEQAIIISRIYSALFATALIPLLFFIGKRLQDERTGIVAAVLATLSVGFIQFSHFGTFEMWLTFFSVLLFWAAIVLLEKKRLLYVLLLGIFFGALMAIKVSSLVLLPIPILALALQLRNKKQSRKFHRLHLMLLFLGNSIFFISIATLVYISTNPYVMLDTPAFVSAMKYESGVGLNTVPVFYTGGFYDTIPVLYQFVKVYPFLLNPLITFMFIPAFFYILFLGMSKRSLSFLLLTSCFLLLFLSQAFLFIKWTRYMVPTLPFIYLILALALQSIRSRIGVNILMGTLAITSCIFAFSYFITAFVQSDTRITAAAFAGKFIPDDAKIISETNDLGNIAFDKYLPSRIEFNFYDYDLNSPDYTEASLTQYLNDSQYILLASQRIVQPRLDNPKKFPKGYAFYSKLLDGRLGYQKIYETPCDIFCQITYLGDPIKRYEQTASVFDRPTVQLFRKSY